MGSDPLQRRAGLRPQKSPVFGLSVIFLAWKFFLCALLAFSPGRGYDTSTQLALGSWHRAGGSGWFLRASDALLERLSRWDAIYFLSAAQRGHRYEQEWAFGWGYSKLISLVANGFASTGRSVRSLSSAAFFISFVSHWLSVLCLHRLSLLIQGPRKEKQAFLSACLHIFAPAGAFLLAPYGESLFSFLQFLGMLLYLASAYDQEPFSKRTASKDAGLLASGLLFGLSATVRSNGILGGTIYALDATLLLPQIFQVVQSAQGLRYAFALFTGGVLIAAGFALPQFFAYEQFCTGSTDAIALRPWCSEIPPSISSFVQKHYWDVGFLKYWTFPNLPLFLIALPMIVSLTYSAYWAIRIGYPSGAEPDSAKRRSTENQVFRRRLLRLAIPQGLLATLSLVSFHVQIINRLASGYPLLYIWLADLIFSRRTFKVVGTSLNLSKWTVRWMIMYALIQGGLFSNFLPPA